MRLIRIGDDESDVYIDAERVLAVSCVEWRYEWSHGYAFGVKLALSSEKLFLGINHCSKVDESEKKNMCHGIRSRLIEALKNNDVTHIDAKWMFPNDRMVRNVCVLRVPRFIEGIASLRR